MNLEKKYPELFQFFVGYFSDADLNGLSDKNVVQNYINDCTHEELNNTIVELKGLIQDTASWDDVIKEANRYFENNDEKLKWLNFIFEELKDIN